MFSFVQYTGLPYYSNIIGCFGNLNITCVVLLLYIVIEDLDDMFFLHYLLWFCRLQINGPVLIIVLSIDPTWHLQDEVCSLPLSIELNAISVL